MVQRLDLGEEVRGRRSGVLERGLGLRKPRVWFRMHCYMGNGFGKVTRSP